MKRLIAGVVIAIAGAIGFVSSAGAQSTEPYISNFAIDYYLGRDDTGRSTLRVTERITTEFPKNKNKGMVREIPREYDGRSVSFKLDSVTRNGETEPIYDQRNEGEVHIIETGTDDYINGTQIFEFKYSMRDVTRYFSDTGRDEFYWDTNGTGWRSDINNLSVTLTLDEELRFALTGDKACYQGAFGSTQKCDIKEEGDGFTVSTSGLAAGENVTLAVGFKQGTFAAYQQTLLEKLFQMWVMLSVVTGVIAVVVVLWLLFRMHRLMYREAELGTIVPEYLPPKDASVATSAAVSPGLRAAMPAELTDLAVRHFIQILQTRVKKVFLPAEYDIKVIKDISDLREEEKEILSDMFGYAPAVDKRLSLKDLKNNSAAYARFLDNSGKLRDLLRKRYGLERIDQEKRGWFSRAAKILLAFAVILLSPGLLVASVVAFIISKTLWVLSDKGLELRRYVKGLEMYIKVAEKDRIKMLQSPEGAEKTDIKDPTNPAQLVKLYEKVLPYAILFGHEKEWSRQLGEYYASTNSSPDWYSGRAAFNAAVFSSAMTSFSSSVSATAASSSSSGGSGGGGFSGGGGGGGGGGFR